MAMAFAREASGRVALSFIGEGGCSLGEWHEAINLCAVGRLPAIFCIQNNQTALSTPVADQSAARVFADKAAGYGVPGITLDGTDPDQIAAAFAWAVERARAGAGPTLIELVSMRMCGHAHHDDMLYSAATLSRPGNTPRRAIRGTWIASCTITGRGAIRSRRMPPGFEGEGVVKTAELEQWRREAETVVEEQARAIVAAPWPDPRTAGAGVFAEEAPRAHIEVLDPAIRLGTHAPDRLPALEPGPPVDPRGRTFLDAVTLAIGDALRADPRVFVYGEDVAGTCGNAFLLLRPLLPEFGDRIVNSPVAEVRVLGVCVGRRWPGCDRSARFSSTISSRQGSTSWSTTPPRRVIGGALGCRWSYACLSAACGTPGRITPRTPEPWFYRTPGLKIVVPSTPHDARASLRPRPWPIRIPSFTTNISRSTAIRASSRGWPTPPAPIPIGRAALRRSGSDLAILSYGAYAHVAMRVAARLAADGIEASVLDLRSLAPLDRAAVLAVARHCHRVLIVHEDSRTGGIGESLAAIIQEEAFEALDAPVRIVGALDTPVPYSPPLEEFFLPERGAGGACRSSAGGILDRPRLTRRARRFPII